jgi:hypothetical protein
MFHISQLKKHLSRGTNISPTFPIASSDGQLKIYPATILSEIVGPSNDTMSSFCSFSSNGWTYLTRMPPITLTSLLWIRIISRGRGMSENEKDEHRLSLWLWEINLFWEVSIPSVYWAEIYVTYPHGKPETIWQHHLWQWAKNVGKIGWGAILFHACRRSKKELGDEFQKKDTKIHLSVHWDIFIWIWNVHLNVLEIVGSLRFQWAQTSIINYPGLWTRWNLWLRKEKKI